MTVKLVTEHHLEFISLRRDCTGSSESTLVKMPHCLKTHAAAQMLSLCSSNSGDTAWKLLPIAEEYQLKSIKKKCSDALMKTLKLMRAENEIGIISTKEILKYLACSEKHGFKKLKAHCIEECAANFNLSRRKEVINDKHITEATKLKILDKMSDNMTLDYENRLQHMHSEYERGYSEVNKKLKHQKEITDNWKEDMKQDVDAILSEATKAHKELVEDVEKKSLISDVEEQLDRLSEAVMHEVEQMKEQLQGFLDNVASRKDDAIRAVERARMSKDQKLILVEDNTDTDEKDYAPAYLYILLFPLIRTFENQVECRLQIIESNANKFERNITTRLQRCPLEQIETGLSNQFILQDNYDRLIAEINSKEQIVTDANYMVEKARLSHEKTKAELQKYTKKFSRVNTWIRWATPLEEDENKCLCFRHVTSRSTPRSAKR